MNLDQLPHPIIFAHRGASAYAPENTLAAFELAIRQGAVACELDVKLSADKQVVVIHDQTVDRTTSHHGRVDQMTLAELRELDAGSHFDLAFKGEKIPTLDAVFELARQRIFINVEITNYAHPLDALPEKIAACVQRHRLEEGVMFSSFNWVSLVRIHRLVPQAPIGLLALPGKLGAAARGRPGQWVRYQSLHPEHQDVTAELVARTHQADCKLYTYTVNREEDMRRLLTLGVDGIFTDDLVLAHQVVSSLA